MKSSSVWLRPLGVALAIAAAAAAPAGAQTEEGIRFRSEAIEVGIGGRLQTQFNTTSVDDRPESELILRRVRLELGVKLNDVVSGRIHPDFAGDRVSLKDAYLELNLDPALQLRTGKFYRPFSLLELTSSTRILPIERAAKIRGITAWDENALVHDLGYADRDIGVQVMGAPEGLPFGLSYQAGVFQGPSHYVGDEAVYQYVARLGAEPVDGVAVGAAWSSRGFSRASASPGNDFDIRRGSAFEVDVEIGGFAPGFHLLGEVTTGDFDPFTGDRFTGAHAWLAYRTRPMGRVSAVEPIFRLSHGDVQRGAAAAPELGGTLITPGLNVYLGGRNRLMFNYDLWRTGGPEGDQSSFKAMFQLAF